MPPDLFNALLTFCVASQRDVSTGLKKKSLTDTFTSLFTSVTSTSAHLADSFRNYHWILKFWTIDRQIAIFHFLSRHVTNLTSAVCEPLAEWRGCEWHSPTVG